jgi:hypothetical protein
MNFYYLRLILFIILYRVNFQDIEKIQTTSFFNTADNVDTDGCIAIVRVVYILLFVHRGYHHMCNMVVVTTYNYWTAKRWEAEGSRVNHRGGSST